MLDLTPFLRYYGKWRNHKLSSSKSAEIQENVLRQLLLKATGTKFGKDHNFTKIFNVAEYQQQVPLRTYEQHWNEYWKDPFPNLANCTWPGVIPFFPVSSGTSSGATKYIPCSYDMIRSNTKAGLDLLVHHITNRPESKLFSGKSFMLGGSTELVMEAAGIYSGDLSGISVAEMPWWIRPRYFPPKELALIKNWEEKINILGTESLKQNITMLSGVPSWLLIFFDKLSEMTGKNGAHINDFYPNLELLVHGGVNFSPYYERFKKLLSGSNAELREVYPASEGFIAVADRGYGEGLRVVLDHGIFYEFVPKEELHKENPTRHWIGNIETGVDYAIVLTTCAGLWSYVIGDTVQFIDRETPRLLVSGRTSYYLSSFGEHLTGDEIERSVVAASQAITSQVEEFSVGTLYPEKTGELGGHLYVIEFSEPNLDQKRKEIFLETLDSALCKLNDDYMAHRAEGFGLNPPKLLCMQKGGFAAWMKKRGKLGGQNKVPRIITKQELFSDLVEFAEQLTR